MPRRLIVQILASVLIIFAFVAVVAMKMEGPDNQLAITTDLTIDMTDMTDTTDAAADVTTDITADPQIKFTAEIIELTTDQGQNYFVNYRIKREYFRQETKEMLRLLIESDIAETRAQAQESWLQLSKKIAQEAEIENVLKMKGFRDVVSEVHKQNVNVTILADDLKQQDISVIKSVTAAVTGYTRDKIGVSARA